MLKIQEVETAWKNLKETLEKVRQNQSDPNALLTESEDYFELTNEVGVKEAVDRVFVNTQQISLSVKQQAVAVQQVLSAMNEINVGSKQTEAGISQVKVTTEKLNEAARELQAAV